MTIGIDLGDVWSHYCTLNEDGEVVDRGRFRTTPAGIEEWFTDLPRARVAMEKGNPLDLGQRTSPVARAASDLALRSEDRGEEIALSLTFLV